MKILFQGDSVTDGGRDRRNYHDLGGSYPRYASRYIKEMFPDIGFEFINQGISGNRTGQLFDRLYTDAIQLEPDIISLLIGVNDVWHRYDSNHVETTDEQIEANYRSILISLRKHTDSKIVIMSPYVLDFDGMRQIRDDVKRITPVIEKLAGEFADVYIPLDTLMDNMQKMQAEEENGLSKDGVHPTAKGAEYIGRVYADYIKELLM